MMFGQQLNIHRIFKVTSKGSDQSAHMRRLVWAFAGRKYHIVGNIMPQLKYSGQVLNTFENIMENWAFSNTYDTSKVSKCIIMQ